MNNDAIHPRTKGKGIPARFRKEEITQNGSPQRRRMNFDLKWVKMV